MAVKGDGSGGGGGGGDTRLDGLAPPGRRCSPDAHLVTSPPGLGHVQHALYSGPCGRRSQPRAFDLGSDLRLPVCERRPRARRARVLLSGQTLLEFRLAFAGLARLRRLLLREGRLRRLALLGGLRVRLALLFRLALVVGLALLLGLLRLRSRFLRGALLGLLLGLGRGLRLLTLLLALREFLRRRWRRPFGSRAAAPAPAARPPAAASRVLACP